MNIWNSLLGNTTSSSDSDDEICSYLIGLNVQDKVTAWIHEFDYGSFGEEFPTTKIRVSDLLSPKQKLHEMKVRLIAFSQSSVSDRFKDGRLLKDTTEQLASGEISPQQIPPIRVVKYNQKWVSLDNRRLRVFMDAFVESIPVIQCSLETPEIAQEFWAKKSNKLPSQRGAIKSFVGTTSNQHFEEGIFVFNKRVLNWNLSKIQKSKLGPYDEELPFFFDSREEYFESFEELIFEEARAILQSGSEQASLDQAPLLTLSLLRPFRSPKNAENPGELRFKILKNEGQEFRAGEAFLLSHAVNKDLQLIGIANYSENSGSDLEFSLKVVVDQEILGDHSKTFEQEQKWFAKSIGSLITLQRMFDSCTTFQGRSETQLERLIWSGKERPSRYLANPLSEKEELILSSLNPSQYQPVKEFLQMKQGLKMIQGPPGTGKTTTVSKLLIALENRGERILVCASSNKGAQTLAEICLKECPQVPMILIGVEKKLPASGSLHEIFFDLWGQRQIQALQDLSGNLWKFQTTEIVQGEFKFVKQRAYAASQKLRKKKEVFGAFVKEVTPYRLSCFKDLAEVNELVQKYLDVYCEYLQTLDEWEEILTYCNEEKKSTEGKIIKIPEAVKISRQCLSELSTRFSSLLMKLESLAADSSENGLEMQLLNHSRIIFSTLSTSGQQRLKTMLPVDSLIIDEAGQSLEAETMIPLKAEPEKCLLVGDIQQLPATVISRQAEKLKFGRSMMERLSKDCNIPCSMLTIQYRMDPEICSFPSRTFYQGKLENHPSVESKPLALPKFLAPYAFIDIQGQEKKGPSGCSFMNEAEIKSIQTILAYLQEQKIDVNKRVGVITFYKAQSDKIRETCKNTFPQMIVNTVDGFQGGECDIIIISCVRANAQNKIGFLDEYKRLNVALTRAKKSLIILGNAAALNQGNLGLLVADAKERNLLHPSTVLQQLIPKKVLHPIAPKKNNTPIIGIQPSNPNYKRDLCRHFTGQGGSCSYGNKCRFSHGQVKATKK